MKKTIWEIFTELVETDQVSLSTNKRQVIWQVGDKKIEIVNQPTGLILSATISGQVIDSKPLAICQVCAWQITDNAVQKYSLWQKAIQAYEAMITLPKPGPEITNPKAVNQKAKSHTVTPLDGGTFRVRSGNSGQEYFVRLQVGEGATCDCAWGQYRKFGDGYRSGCSHVIAVYQNIEGQFGRQTSAWATKADAQRQRRPVIEIGDGVVLTLRKI